jgi:hypothetical protein
LVAAVALGIVAGVALPVSFTTIPSPYPYLLDAVDVEQGNGTLVNQVLIPGDHVTLSLQLYATFGLACGANASFSLDQCYVGVVSNTTNPEIGPYFQSAQGFQVTLNLTLVSGTYYVWVVAYGCFSPPNHGCNMSAELYLDGLG